VKKVFVDTTAFYALLDSSDLFHKTARLAFERAEIERWHLVCTNYILHESWALIQYRLGWDAVDEFLDVLVPMCEIVFVDEMLHALGVARCRQARQRDLSLTDCISIEVIRQQHIRFALAQDKHFSRERLELPV